jgi:hypothetical protein
VRLRARLPGLATALAICYATASCASGGRAVSPPQPPVVPGAATTGPDLTGIQLPSFVMPQIKGGIARPNPKLTPGIVAITNTNEVCALPDHGDLHPIASALQLRIYAEYGDTTKSERHKHILNYLVPLDLGGGTGADNIWAASLRGTGYYQVVETDHVIRDLVCRRALPLRVAQHDMQTDWYAAWLRYVVATGDA